ncbi:MAG: cupin-like domain-containing protein [Planctomycetaceae bacterium]|nr:cupin-like domain-containing protein [Planctomycetaceae bacterium]
MIDSSKITPAHVNEPERVSGLSYKEFVNEFRKPRKPVIFQDATRNWKALEWTPEILREKCGQREVLVRHAEGEKKIRFDELVDSIDESTVDDPFLYARNIDVEHDLPDLWNDIQPSIKYMDNDWRCSRLLPKNFMFPSGLQEFFFGGAGASFPKLHVDYWGMDGFVNQIYNNKEFYFVSPDQSDLVYGDEDGGLTSRIENIADPDFERFPKFEKANMMYFTLRPGDTLYMPNGWWHTTYMPETSITVIGASWNAQNWPRFCQQYRERAQVTKIKKAAMLGYLKAFGLLKQIAEPVGF